MTIPTTRTHDRGLLATSMLVQNIARDLIAARDHVAAELATLDGYPGGESERVSGSSELTPTEAIASARLGMRRHMDDIEAGVHLLNVTAADVARSLRGVLGTRVPADFTVCHNSQSGKEGVDRWGDPLCNKPPVKAGMCQAHYMAWYRARQAAGVDVTHDFAM